MVPKGSRNFSKQFGRGIKMERKRENGLMQKDMNLKYFFSSLKIFIPFS
jgi:hypothetical protein